MKQDRNGVRTPQDLERKYNLADLVGIKKAVELQEEGINQTNATLEQFMSSALDSINDLQQQIDGSITTYYCSGVPTLDNYPTNEWPVEDYPHHVGNMYYDKDTGYAYRFFLDGDTYRWVKIADSDVEEALRLASLAQDTADGKRRVFTTVPFVPYDVGDLWLYAKDLYVCKIPKTATETYLGSDWEIATKYTDDTALNTFVSGEYADDLIAINNSIDKKSETWYQNEDPSTNWTTVELKTKHVGDLWYKKSENKNYIYTSSYTWVEIDGVPDSVYDKIDGKAQIFASQPVAPYYVGDLYVQGSNGDILVCITERLSGSYTASEWKKASKYTDDSALNAFISGDYADDLEAINDSIDKKAETWYQSTDPSVSWTTTELKKAHVGDLWYDTTENKNYTYTSAYTWQEIDGVPDSVYDEIDGKAQIFTSQPTVPYHKGDLYTQGTNGDILVSTVDRLTGSYTASDWVKASKYTDDTLLNNFISDTYNKDISNINEQIDKKAETWYQDTNPATNWTTTEVKESHVGDLWYNTTENKNYIYTDSYTWLEVDGVPDDVYDKIDGKAQIFASQPKPPYYVGDLYTEGANGDIYVCQTERLTGNYTASDWKKASKYTDDTNLNNFVNNVYPEDLAELTNQIDSKITTWYYSGEPTLNNAPANSWLKADYIKHTGDLYYDKETGYTYTFQATNNVYGWVHIVDADLTEALAIANAAKDTADNKRRIFTSTPIPPYDNGDLWFNNEEIYICQISKAEGETYASGDFIIATKYTDDTVATQVGNELTVVKGQVTTINEKANGLEVVITENTSLINSLTGEVADEIDTRAAMIRLQQENGIPIVELGTTESSVKTKYKNDGMYIEENGSTTSYFKNGKAYNYDMEAINSLTIGRFAFKPRENGNLSLVYIGGGEE